MNRKWAERYIQAIFLNQRIYREAIESVLKARCQIAFSEKNLLQIYPLRLTILSLSSFLPSDREECRRGYGEVDKRDYIITGSTVNFCSSLRAQNAPRKNKGSYHITLCGEDMSKYLEARSLGQIQILGGTTPLLIIILKVGAVLLVRPYLENLSSEVLFS